MASSAATAAARQSFRVFVGNLPWTIGSTELRQFASAYGPVVHSQVVFDKKTGLSKGFGFVTFGNREGFNTLVKGGGAGSGVYFLEGNYLNVNPANSQMQSTGTSGTSDE